VENFKSALLSLLIRPKPEQSTVWGASHITYSGAGHIVSALFYIIIRRVIINICPLAKGVIIKIWPISELRLIKINAR
jgi:hypothetical protein